MGYHPDRPPDHNQGIEVLGSSRAEIGLVVPERSRERADDPILQRIRQDRRHLVVLRHGNSNR